MEEETPPFAPDPAPEALDNDFVKLQLGSLKKPKKKSRISVARVAFEDGWLSMTNSRLRFQEQERSKIPKKSNMMYENKTCMLERLLRTFFDMPNSWSSINHSIPQNSVP